MELTFAGRRKLKRGIIIGLTAALILLLIWTCWIIWVERHIVYTRDGAVVDFAATSGDFGYGTLAVPPVEQETVSIYYNDGSDVIALDTSLRQLRGYYISADMLANDMDTIRATVAALPVGSAVMMEVKSIKGSFYYTSGVEGASLSTGMDLTAVDALIEDISSRNLYLIGNVPAFRDRNYGLKNTSCGLPFIGGQGALWLDDSGCYWLDPTKKGTMTYLTNIASELRIKGFDEIIFTDFCFPGSPEIDFSGDKVAAVQDAAVSLVENCASDRFAVSFLTTDSTIQPVTGRSRLYITDVPADNAASVAARYAVEDPAVNLVFLTDSYDTRYENYSVLRPMDSASVG